MGRFILNSLTLANVGVRLLPDEHVDIAVELEAGITDDLEQSRSTLLLTNKRLIRYSASGHKTGVISSALDDVDTVDTNEVTKSQKRRQWVWVGAVFMLGGFILAMSSLALGASLLSPSLMAFALLLIAVVFVLSYAGGNAGEVVIRAGSKEIKCKMHKQAVEDMGLFVQRAFALKMGYNTSMLDAENLEIMQEAATTTQAAH
jgi:hypothetical protein